MGLNIARGLVKDLSGINKFGFADSVNSSWTDISIGSVGYPTIADKVSVVSTSGDDAAGGAGAYEIEIQGLDAAGYHAVEIMAVTGTAPILSTGDFQRVYRMKVCKAGTAGGSVGELIASIGGIEVSRIDPEFDNQTLQAAFTVPVDKTGYITSLTISAAKDNSPVMAAIYVREPGIDTVFNVKQLVNIFRNTTTIEFRVPIKVSSMSDIVVRAKADTSNVEVSASWNMILEQNRT